MFMAKVNPDGADLVGYGKTIDEAKEALRQILWDWRTFEGEFVADIEDSVNFIMKTYNVKIYKKDHRALEHTGYHFWKEIKE